MTKTRKTLLKRTESVSSTPGQRLSRVAGKGPDNLFTASTKDAGRVCQFIVLYLNRHNRWNAKVLMGEATDRFRSRCRQHLQKTLGVQLNGIVSCPDPDLGSDEAACGRRSALVNSCRATPLWPGPTSAEAIRPSVEPFWTKPAKFAPAKSRLPVSKGRSFRRERGAGSGRGQQMSHFTGLSEDYLVRADLRG